MSVSLLQGEFSRFSRNLGIYSLNRVEICGLPVPFLLGTGVQLRCTSMCD